MRMLSLLHFRHSKLFTRVDIISAAAANFKNCSHSSKWPRQNRPQREIVENLFKTEGVIGHLPGPNRLNELLSLFLKVSNKMRFWLLKA